jgi:hypothetical protein
VSRDNLRFDHAYPVLSQNSEDKMAKSLKIGDRVEGGKSGTDDYDRGRVVRIDRKSKIAEIMWDQGVVTSATFDSVEVVGKRGPRGAYPDRE